MPFGKFCVIMVFEHLNGSANGRPLAIIIHNIYIIQHFLRLNKAFAGELFLKI